MKDQLSAVGKNAEDIKRTLAAMQGNRGAQNTQIVRFEGGGPVWIAVTCCLVMLAAGAVGALWMSRELTRVDKELLERKEEGQRMQSYLSAIYVNAPHLKPAEEHEDAAD